MKYLSASLILSLCLLYACVPPSKQEITTIDLDIDRSEIRQLIDFQNADQTDSLYTFLNHEDPSLRLLATSANASLATKMTVDSVAKMLDDKIMNVRAAAAYALGQYQTKKPLESLIAAFKNEDTISINTMLNHNILEAIGKCGDSKLLEFLSSTNTYRETDTLLLLGQARGIYRFALRGMNHPNGTDRMIKHVTNLDIDSRIRLVAAHYLSRSKDLDIDNYKFQLTDIARQEKNSNIKMALLSALKHTSDPDILEYLLSELSTANDYRTKVNIIKAIYHHPYERVVDQMVTLLKNNNEHIAYTASQYFVEHGRRQDASYYRELTQDTMHYLAKANLFKATLKYLPAYYLNTRFAINKELQEEIEKSNNNYERLAYLETYSEDPNAYGSLMDLFKESRKNIFKSKLAECISTIYKNKNYPLNQYRVGPIGRSRILEDLKTLMASEDVGVLYYIANAISDNTILLNTVIKDVDFLNEAKNKLKLPRDVETYNALVNAIKTCKPDTNISQFIPEAKSSIDWSLAQKYPDSTIAIIKTNKGLIKVDFFFEQAPMSVFNFIKLADKNFYDKKVFHRVVPNFVIQGGCPRGDGFGSSDETIRSELSQAYYDDQGYIGMASAGPHTESTQWFITHSPTPHLDGRYTIFGKVIEGMDVVHKILPGDRIQDVILTSVH